MSASGALSVRVRGRHELAIGSLEIDQAGRFGLRPLPTVEIEAKTRSSAATTKSALSRLERLSTRSLELRRRAKPQELDYLILVPTLRCNLSCEYCQVSRASPNATGHDWSDDTVDAVVSLVGGLTANSVKIEFQGGEPTLRPDLITKVIEAVPAPVKVQFVICTNLEVLTDEITEIFDRPNVAISTSLDGPSSLHSAQRSGTSREPSRFLQNLRFVADRYGPGKVSALPTINPQAPPDPDALIDAFLAFGLTEIYLRPINFMGFARKKHPGSRESNSQWTTYYEQFLRRIIERNYEDRSQVISESYFTLILKRIFRPGLDRHVDLRNPNPVGVDYVVIDHDGTVYPTDEARMLTRAGVIDLSIGDVVTGWQTEARAALDHASTNDGDPACEACAYKPYCGRDIVDDISRYGRVDLPRQETAFCKRHLHLFDLAFELLYSSDEKVRYSLARWLDLPGELPEMEMFQ